MAERTSEAPMVQTGSRVRVISEYSAIPGEPGLSEYPGYELGTEHAVTLIIGGTEYGTLFYELNSDIFVDPSEIEVIQ